MNTKNTALLLVDSQNDFLSPEGKMHGAVKAVLEEHDMPNRLNMLIGACREHGVQVIHTPISFGEGCPEAGSSPYGIMAPVAQSGAFITGTWGAKVAEVLDQAESDIVIEKHRICAFEGSELESALRDRGIETLIVAGLLTDNCVEATIRIAYDKGFEVFAVTDATATLDPDKQKLTTEQSFPLFSKPITHTEALQMLASAATVQVATVE